MEDIYTNDTYLQNNPSWHEEDAPYKAEMILKLLQRNNIPLQTVCEIGCGSGEILRQLSRKLPGHIAYTGMDISPQAIAIADKKTAENIRFELRDITTAPQQGGFDLLLVIDVIEHLENYFRFLREIRPQGTHTVFHIPLDMSVWSLFREAMLIESKQRVGHIHNFTEDFVKSILSDCGFRIVDCLYTAPIYKQLSAKEKVIRFVRETFFRIHPRYCTKTIGGYSILVLASNS